MVIKHKHGVKYAISGYAASVKCRVHLYTVFNFQLFASLPRSHFELMLMKWQEFYVHFIIHSTWNLLCIKWCCTNNNYKNIEKYDLRHICIIWKKNFVSSIYTYSLGAISHLKVFSRFFFCLSKCKTLCANVNWNTRKRISTELNVQLHGHGHGNGNGKHEMACVWN